MEQKEEKLKRFPPFLFVYQVRALNVVLAVKAVRCPLSVGDNAHFLQEGADGRPSSSISDLNGYKSFKAVRFRPHDLAIYSK